MFQKFDCAALIECDAATDHGYGVQVIAIAQTCEEDTVAVETDNEGISLGQALVES